MKGNWMLEEVSHVVKIVAKIWVPYARINLRLEVSSSVSPGLATVNLILKMK